MGGMELVEVCGGGGVCVCVCVCVCACACAFNCDSLCLDTV